MAWDEAYLCTKWHLDSSSRLATIGMGRKLGALPLFGGGEAGFPSNTMWPAPTPTSMPSFILIHPTIWQQYTNVTDKQDRTDRQWSYSKGWTALQTVAQKNLKRLVVVVASAAVGCIWHLTVLTYNVVRVISTGSISEFSEWRICGGWEPAGHACICRQVICNSTKKNFNQQHS